MKLLGGDCLEVLKTLETNSIDSIVTDPPYGISFMNKHWDYQMPSVEVWRECLRVLKPGGHALIACGTRTQHRMAVNIEDAGFEIRDVITWLYGSGFPKSLDVSKAIDKANGDSAKRPIIGKIAQPCANVNKTVALGGSFQESPNLTSAASAASAAWEGWGTALKPACEFWTLARKPLGEKTVAANVLKHGTGGINVDGCRIDAIRPAATYSQPDIRGNAFNSERDKRRTAEVPANLGRFPANLILDEEAGALLDEQSGPCKTGGRTIKTKCGDAFFKVNVDTVLPIDLGSGASRFFYTAKASKSERNAGCEGMAEKELRSAGGTTSSGKPTMEGRDRFGSIQSNHHPTVKPVKLMRYLCRLITPPGGIVLDPFMGSGSTGVAARDEGFDFIGVELQSEYLEIAKKRVKG